jgi:ribosomal protein S18 acetylase RimI-like enzyme
MANIIKAEDKHIPDICRLWLEFIKYHTDLDATIAPGEEFFKKGLESTSGFEKEFLRPAMTSEKRLVQVAMEGNTAVGYSVAEIQECPNSEIKFSGVINQLHVTPSCRRRGTGKKLYDETIKWFHSNNISVVQLQLLARNPLARTFWRKEGFGDYQYTWIKRI